MSSSGANCRLNQLTNRSFFGLGFWLVFGLVFVFLVLGRGFSSACSKKTIFFFWVIGPWLSLVFKRFKQEPRVFLTRFFALFVEIVL